MSILFTPEEIRIAISEFCLRRGYGIYPEDVFVTDENGLLDCEDIYAVLPPAVMPNPEVQK